MKIIKKIICLFLFSFSPFAFSENTHDYFLPNGLKLIVKEDHRAPVVVSQVWYKVGSSYEHNGITGISHALEHMMFRGTHKYGPGKLDKIIIENGGKQNAFTDYDFTTYYQLINADNLGISFELESDRMSHLLLDPMAFSKEIEVVMEERRMRIDDNPEQTLLERLIATAFISTSYHHPVVGWMNDLKNMTIGDLRHWYEQWYVPNNAIVVVVGDVNADKVYHLAQHYFGAIRSRVLPHLKPEEEVKSLGTRQVIVHMPAELPCLALSYNVPVINNDLKSETPYVLNFISALLSQGESSLLKKELIRRQQFASDVNTSYDPFSRLSTLFLLTAVPAQDHSISELKVALLDQIKRLKTTLITNETLNRVKAQLLAEKIYEEDSIEQQAYRIGSLEAVGLSWSLDKDFKKHIDTVTPQAIQAIAKRYFTEDRLTIAILIPSSKPLTKQGTSLIQGIAHVQ